MQHILFYRNLKLIPFPLLKPLMKISMTMKDSLILVLRKAMFARYICSFSLSFVHLFILFIIHQHLPFIGQLFFLHCYPFYISFFRQEESRKIAVAGLLLILKHFKVKSHSFAISFPALSYCSLVVTK